MLKAWTLGALVLLVAQGLWFGLILARMYVDLLVLLLWVSPVAASLMVAYASPRKRIEMGVSMALVAASLVVAFNAAFQLIGTAVDFPGAKGGVILFLMTLLYSGPGAALGSVVGQWLTRKRVGSISSLTTD